MSMKQKKRNIKRNFFKEAETKDVPGKPRQKKTKKNSSTGVCGGAAQVLLTFLLFSGRGIEIDKMNWQSSLPIRPISVPIIHRLLEAGQLVSVAFTDQNR